MPQTPATPPRRPYRSPSLIVYGDLTALTLTSPTNAMNDPGNSSTTRT